MRSENAQADKDTLGMQDVEFYAINLGTKRSDDTKVSSYDDVNL
jgi:hypothetical protein